MLSKKLMKVVLSGMISLVVLGSTNLAVYADTLVEKNEVTDVGQKIIFRVNLSDSFEDFMKYDIKKKDITEEDMLALKNIYNDVFDLKKEGKFEEANMKMKNFYEICNKYENLYKTTYVNEYNLASNQEVENSSILIQDSFENFMKNEIKKKNVSEEDKITLENIYNDVFDLKKEGKLEEANVKMKNFYEICNKYEDLYKNNQIIVESVEDIVNYVEFDDFMINDIKKLNVSEEDYLKAKKLYEESNLLRSNGKIKQSLKIMNDIYNLMKNYEDIEILAN